MSNNSNNNSVLPFIIGVLVGGILGILFAPRKGSETREAIGEFLSDIQENGKNFIMEEKEKIVSDIKEIQGDIKEVIKKETKKIKNITK